MGGTTSREKCLQAERDLLQWGVDWWLRSRAPEDANAIAFEQADNEKATLTKSTTAPADFHLHHVRYSCSAKEEHTAPPLVVMHGYLNGVGIFYTTMPALAESWPGQVYAIDMAGCGLSSRPPWTGGFGESSNLEATENYFTESLEGWRKRMGIERWVLAGHSMGGYLATCYAEKYPDRVAHLVLLSPVGIAKRESEVDLSDRPFFFRLAFKLWNRGWSPINLPGTWQLVKWYGQRRYPDASWVNKPLLSLYKYYSWVCDNPSAGAYCHSTLLKPGAWARSPLIDRLPQLSEKLHRISFIYGVSDWMDPGTADHFQSLMKSEEYRHKACPIDVMRVAGAGHNFMVDNPRGTTDAIVECLMRGLGKSSQKEGREVYGNMPWLVERGLAGPQAPNLVGRSDLEAQVTRSEWQACEVIFDHNDGFVDLRWKDTGKVVRRFSGSRLRAKESEAAPAGGESSGAVSSQDQVEI